MNLNNQMERLEMDFKLDTDQTSLKFGMKSGSLID